jgi:transketolase
MSSVSISSKVFSKDVELRATREGFGSALLDLGTNDDSIVALCADLTESTQMHHFKNTFPERFFEIGIAEQNLVTVASGLAHQGLIPFCASYAAFSPGRNWEQIRTTICLNNQPVKIVGAHAGLSVGPDGATHQMLEDIALMRCLPNIDVVVPIDYFEAKKATMAIAHSGKPAYLRLTREKSAVITTDKTIFIIGKANIISSGSDITIIAQGPITYNVLMATKKLKDKNISVDLINLHTVKPLDNLAILSSAHKTKLVITVEEGQINGGMGSAVAELLSEKLPTKVYRLGVNDRFGQSGTVDNLYHEYGLSSRKLYDQILNIYNMEKK